MALSYNESDSENAVYDENQHLMRVAKPLWEWIINQSVTPNVSSTTVVTTGNEQVEDDSAITTGNDYDYLILNPTDDWDIKAILGRIQETGGNNGVDYQVLKSNEDDPNDPSVSLEDWNVISELSGSMAAGGSFEFVDSLNAEAVAVAVKNSTTDQSAQVVRRISASDNPEMTEVIGTLENIIGKTTDSAAGFDVNGSAIAQLRQIVKTLGDESDGTASKKEADIATAANILQRINALVDALESNGGETLQVDDDALGDETVADQQQRDYTAKQTALEGLLGIASYIQKGLYQEGEASVTGDGTENNVSLQDEFGNSITNGSGYVDIRGLSQLSLRASIGDMPNNTNGSSTVKIYLRRTENADDEETKSVSIDENTTKTAFEEIDVNDFGWVKVTENSPEGTHNIWFISANEQGELRLDDGTGTHGDVERDANADAIQTAEQYRMAGEDPNLGAIHTYRDDKDDTLLEEYSFSGLGDGNTNVHTLDLRGVDKFHLMVYNADRDFSVDITWKDSAGNVILTDTDQITNTSGGGNERLKNIEAEAAKADIEITNDDGNSNNLAADVSAKGVEA